MGVLLDVPQTKPIVRRHKGIGRSPAFGAAGPADPMEVIFVLIRNVVIKDRFHVIHVDAPGGDVGGDLDIGDGAGPLGGGEASVGKAANPSESTDASSAAGGDVGAGASTLSKKAGRAGGGGEGLRL